MAPLPTPIRATLGLLATALDAVQELVDHAPEIPMEAVGNSMQLSLRLQQRYVALLTRGDELIASLRGAPEEPPAWATFDDAPPSAAGADSSDPESPGADSAGVDPSDDVVAEPDSSGPDSSGSDSFDAFLSTNAVDDLPDAEVQDGPRHAGQGDPLLTAATKARAATAKKAAAKKVGAPSAAKKAAAKKTAAVKAVPIAPAKKTPAVRTAGGSADDVATPLASALESAAPILIPDGVAATPGRPPRKASPRKASPREASPRKASPREASPRKASPRKAAAAEPPAPSAAADPADLGAVDASASSAIPALQLDEDVTVGAASARQPSAFDLAEAGDGAGGPSGETA